MKNEWWKKREAKLREAFSLQEQALLSELDAKKRALELESAHVESRRQTLELQRQDLESLKRRNEDRRVDLERATDEVKAQLRLVEAKARPDAVWTAAFATGYRSAWDTMLPLMLEGVSQTKATLRNAAIEQTLANLQPLIEKRLEQAGKTSLRPASQLLAKRDEFNAKLSNAQSEADKAKYNHYLEAIGWMLDGNPAKPN